MLFESNYACGLSKSHAKTMPIPMPMLTPTGSTPTPCFFPLDTCIIYGPPGVWGIWGKWLLFSGSWGALVIIFRDLGSKLIVLGI